MLIKKVANVLGLSDCPASHPDLNAGLCYKRCKENYSGAATVCWSNCPESTINLGGSCVGNVKEGFMKDRGPGKAVDLTANNNNPCTENKDCLKREYHAGFCYEKCADDETRVVDRCYKNCPNTEPGKQDLYRNDGLFCGKKSYGNGWGYVEKGKCEEENYEEEEEEEEENNNDNEYEYDENENENENENLNNEKKDYDEDYNYINNDDI